MCLLGKKGEDVAGAFCCVSVLVVMSAILPLLRAESPSSPFLTASLSVLSHRSTVFRSLLSPISVISPMGPPVGKLAMVVLTRM